MPPTAGKSAAEQDKTVTASTSTADATTADATSIAGTGASTEKKPEPVTVGLSLSWTDPAKSGTGPAKSKANEAIWLY
jgi:hypothetical protein